MKARWQASCRPADTVSATDEDGDVVSFGVDDDRFAIADDGALNVLADKIFDHETENPLTLTITGTDNSSDKFTDTETVNIAITDLAEAPVITVSGTQTLTLEEGTTATETATGHTVATADGDGDVVTFSLDDDRFAVDTNGALNVLANKVFDHETEVTVTLTVTATDDSPSTLSSTEVVDIIITDIEIAPVIFVTGTQFPLNKGTFDAETSTGLAVTATDEDADGMTFSLSDPTRFFVADDDTLKIVAGSVFDYETEKTTTLTVTSTDDNTGALSTTEMVDITVTNVTFTTILFTVDVGRTSAPAFGDVDGDGDDDLLVGVNIGRLIYYRWDGPTTGWTAQTDTDNPFHAADDASDFDVGVRASPAFGDVDRDGDKDLVVGANDGTLSIWYWHADTKTWEATSHAI